MRRTGIELIGDVPWGTHFCQFYQTQQDLIEILVPYFRQGLQDNEFCMWVTSEPLGVDDARKALRAGVPNLDDKLKDGQIEILDYRAWYTKSGTFQADEVLKGWVDKLDSALRKGYEGLRLTGNTFWLEKADWNRFTDYEEMVNSVIGRYRMLAVCTYSLDKCGAAEIIDVIHNHQFALIKKAGTWQIVESGEHRKILHALDASETRYRRLFETAQDGILILDADTGVVRDVNPFLITMLGYAREEIIGRKLWEMGFFKDAQKSRAAFDRLQTEGYVRYEDLPLERKDGTLFEVEFVSNSYRVDDTRVIQCNIRDIAIRKQAEKEIKQHVEALTRFNRAAVDRELRMIELKKQVNELCVKAGLPPAYTMDRERQ